MTNEMNRHSIWWNKHFQLNLLHVFTCSCLVDSGPVTPGGRRGRHDHPSSSPSPPPTPHPPATFLRSKKKRGKQRKKKQKLLKGCHQGQNVTVLAILERLEFKKFSYRTTMVTENNYQCSMAPPL